MTHLTHWETDPIDIFWKNFFDQNSKFQNTIDTKINYPVDIYETENGLRFELAVVGLDKEDLDIQTESDTLRIKHEKKENDIPTEAYYQKGIARRSFDLAWKVSSKLDLTQLEATLDKGLLVINIPYSADKAPKKVEIKVNNKSLLQG
jgi:HSP20 family molecular chaperone IbpA